MSDTTVGSVKQLVKLDLSELRQDFAEMKALMNKQLTVMESAYQKMGSSARAYGKTAISVNEGVASSFTSVLKGAGGAAVVYGNNMKAANKGIVSSFKASLKSALSMERVVSRLAFIGTVGAVYTLGRTISSAFGQGTQDARDFEKALAHVNTVLDDGAKHLMPAYKEGIESISLAYGQGVNELSKSLYDIVSARIDPDFALNVLNDITALAVGNQAELRDVTTAVVGIMNAYNYAASEASTVTDKLQATVKFGRMELQDMAGTLGRVTSAAAALGISLDDVLGSLATMTRQGMNARESVTALRRMLMKLSENANLSAKIQKEGLLSVIPIMELMTTKQKVMFAGGIRGFNAAIIAMKNYVSQGKDVEAIANSEDEALKALGIEVETSGVKLRRAQEKWKKVWRDGSEDFKDFKAGWVESGAEISNVALNIVHDLQSINRGIDFTKLDVKGVENLEAVEEETKKIAENMAKAFSFMPLDNDYSQGDEAILESTNSGLATMKEHLAEALLIDKKRYDNAVAHGKGEADALHSLTITWRRYIDVLSQISDIGGDAFPDFEEQLLDTDTAFQNFLNSLEKGVKILTQDDIVRGMQSEFRELFSLYNTWGELGQDVVPEMSKLWEDHINDLTEELGRGHILVQQATADYELYLESLNKEPELSDFEQWKAHMIKSAFDIKKYWAEWANLMDGISGITVENMNEHFDELYEKFKEIAPGIAEMFKETMEYVSEEMQQLQDAWVGSMSGGISRMVQDMLDGVNMMKKNWADYLKYIVDSFIAALARMAAEKAAYAVFDLIVGALTGGGGVPSGVLASIPNVPNTGGISSPSSNVVNNFNPSFNPNINVGATFSQRDMAFIYKTGKSYYGKTSL